MTTSPKRIDALKAAIGKAANARDADGAAKAWRDVLDYFFEVGADRNDPEPSGREPDYARLWNLAHHAMTQLGGQAAPAIETVADYDADRFGPMLGVSDGGTATAAIRHGALAAPKGVALAASASPLALGIAHDAERLGAVGEVAVGPDEYATIRLAGRNRVLTTTNIGTQVNVRNFMSPPIVRVNAGGQERAIRRLEELFQPFVTTASGRPRSLTVLIRFTSAMSVRQREGALAKLCKAVASGSFCNPKWHKLGLLVDPGKRDSGAARSKAAIDLAASMKLDEVALIGFDELRIVPEEINTLLKFAEARSIRLRSQNWVDPQTTARHVWTGLAVARNMGVELGKYGLWPLTFEDQKEVIARIQYWFPHWCAAPVYYVDYPLVTAKRVYTEPQLADAIRRWLAMVANLGVRVVLIDTAKKSEKRRLLKDSPHDKVGFLTADDIADLIKFAHKEGVKTLWAGGISLPQAYTFGKLGVFGIYVTSAAAALMPLPKKARRDPFLTSLRVPQKDAVTRVKFLVEAGFLVSRGAEFEADIEAMLAAIADEDEAEASQIQKQLQPRIVEAWHRHFSQH